ncbi:hypothetical protein CQ052_05140 [Ochrobactrum sp. MYb15]|nr:hypothetical protein CQZ90_03750 [Ochrobactrum sp. MYb19]PRA62596.1 hypothetical protein CQ053_17135 [Ochrobactrum sp. MYb18]PRA76750.1 hypothetical protein CQ049_05140 [Brucella thiophenivorans]PRA93616.1 hypothetical protein CQ051_03750 [Ochrobactrum sp. MYb14]PRA98757.1 hypothetical protein CQ052_05140 [Ochrobactrum sp. MYb15]
MIKFKQKPISKPARTCRDSVVVRMADAMREMAISGENVSPDTLAHYGFTHDIVDKFGQRAVALARRLSVRQVASHA